MPVTWTIEQFKKQVVSDLMANGEIVGKFIEEDARQRLLNIQNPAWGEGHRKYVSRLLTNTVEEEKNAVVIKLGVPPGQTTKEDKQTRHLGFYIEMGDAHHAEAPYMRPAVFQNAAKIVALLEGK